ncbi:hypothetical protein E2C01_057813 [Portunus trituberculatus]|uniref:Uncharacterized protein n=1 Tax=Portunus trituberculatus TaxID=210409 RepID=A0A5B7GTZ9_PORTR|nr:hypothetical protein [Portunus trituberculatus]
MSNPRQRMNRGLKVRRIWKRRLTCLENEAERSRGREGKKSRGQTHLPLISYQLENQFPSDR